MRDDPAVIALVARARDGDQHAWNELVDRYAPLVWSICTRYQLSRPDIDDVAQTVWLLLVEQLGNLRQPAALPGWLVTTTQRECLRVVRAASRYDSFGSPVESQMSRDQPAMMIEQEILRAELNAALAAAFAGLPPRCRRLLSMLIEDPPVSYAEISATLPIPVGSIGPQRARCLDRLRRSPRLAAFSYAESSDDAVNGASANGTGGARRA
ncbi:MAG TPA: sigma-70 family RNA polymerase sigma factor [Streptosporangiaceae bacterium]|nr:sigma-70 family RNA polymerase sigma factor [Streptosporangiaceae bacterium]